MVSGSCGKDPPYHNHSVGDGSKCRRGKGLKTICIAPCCSSVKVIGVTPIESLFANIKLDQDGTRDESTLARRHPNNLEGEDLNEKIDKSGIGEVKTLRSVEPTLLDSRTLIMIIYL